MTKIPNPAEFSKPDTQRPPMSKPDPRAAHGTKGEVRALLDAASKQGNGVKPPPPRIERPAPPAAASKVRARHWGVVAGFLVMVLLPLLGAGGYLFWVAKDRYASTAGFTVRQEDTASATDILGGLARIAGGSVGGDSNILHQYIRSQDLVATLDARMDLRALFSAHWDDDPVFALWPDASIEALQWYWNRAVTVSYDQSSALIEVEVVAYEPQTARAILIGIVEESERLINELNDRARADAIRHTEQDLEDALAYLREAREAMTRFRIETQLVDPESDLKVRMGVLGNLQEQLAAAMVDYDILVQGVADPQASTRVAQAQRRIEVIRDRIAQERATVSTDDFSGGAADYPTLMSQYEGLLIMREYAEQRYSMAMAASDAAHANADRKSRYLGVYLQPSLPERAQYPQRFMTLGVLALFLLMIWAVGTLAFYAIRDRQ